MDAFLEEMHKIESGKDSQWDQDLVAEKISDAQLKILYTGYTLTLVEHYSVDFDDLLLKMAKGDPVEIDDVIPSTEVNDKKFFSESDLEFSR